MKPVIPFWRLRQEMLRKGFLGGTRGVFSRYRDHAQVGEVTLKVTDRGLELETITTMSRFRKRGLGSQMMFDVCQVADQLGQPLRLTAIPLTEVGLNADDLARWYGKFGFVMIRPAGHGLRMGRHPRSINSKLTAVNSAQQRDDPVPEPEI